MSVIPDEPGHETDEIPDAGLGLLMAVLLVLAVVAAVFT